MKKFFLAILLFTLPFASTATINTLKKFERGMCSKPVEDYAKAIANLQYPSNTEEIKAPFTVINTHEVTDAYLKESGYDEKKMAEMKKYDPIEVYSVSLKSSDKWECLYYITLQAMFPNICDFKAIAFHHCGK
ncbi:MAG: hypothetical protein ACNA7Y_03450 [Gammaproteobacteria bacterium]